MAAPTSYTQNTLVLVANETFANSIGGTLVASNVQVSNLTPNGTNTVIEFSMVGQSLPIVNGSITIYPQVNVAILAGSNGNVQDQLLVSSLVTPTGDQNGAFFLNGVITLRANAKSAGANANQVWGAIMQVQTGVLGGSVDSVKNVYGGAASNGNVNVALFEANTCNISFFVQPQNATTNCNTSITSLIVYAPQSVI